MCVCVRVKIYIHTNDFIYIYIYKFKHIYTYTRIHISNNMCSVYLLNYNMYLSRASPNANSSLSLSLSLSIAFSKSSAKLKASEKNKPLHQGRSVSSQGYQQAASFSSFWVFLGSHMFLMKSEVPQRPSSSPTPEPGHFSLQVFRGRSWGTMQVARLEALEWDPN